MITTPTVGVSRFAEFLITVGGFLDIIGIYKGDLAPKKAKLIPAKLELGLSLGKI